MSRATRVGLHSAVVWKRLYRRPPAAIRSSVGMRMGPPKALEWPKPMSSISTITTLGAPCGALTSKRGGGFTLRASSSVIEAAFGSAIGSVVRFSGSWPADEAARAIVIPIATNAGGVKVPRARVFIRRLGFLFQ